MNSHVDYEELDMSLRRCGASWDAAQSHGMLSSQLAIAGADAGFPWIDRVLEGTDSNNALRQECETLLSELFSATGRALTERQSEFEPLLPDDASAAEARAEALGHWCEGYLHGLVSERHSDDLKQRLAAEPIADIIKDMLEITRATAAGMSDEEAEGSYSQVVEYLRVAAQLVYEELADFRNPEARDSAVH